MSRTVAAVMIVVLLTCPLFCRAASAQELAASAGGGRGQTVARATSLCSCCPSERPAPSSDSGSSESDQRQGGNCICQGCTLDTKLDDVELTLSAVSHPIGLLETLPLAHQPAVLCDLTNATSCSPENGRSLRLLLQSLLL